MVSGLPCSALSSPLFQKELFAKNFCNVGSNAEAHVVLKYLCTVLVLVPKAFAISPILSP